MHFNAVFIISLYFLFVIIVHCKQISKRTKCKSDAIEEDDAFFDIVEDPSQFLENQISPNTKGQTFDLNKNNLHHQELQLPSISEKKEQKKLPSFLFNSDLSKIQSNAKNIENDVRNNFVYYRNIIVLPTLPKEKLDEDKVQLKGDNSNGFTKQKLREINGARRRTFKKLRPIRRKFLKSNKRNGKKGFKQRTESQRKPLEQLKRTQRAVTAKKERIWDHGVIPYEIDNIFNGAHKALFKQAMRHWENFTCIKFVERDPKTHPNYIYFTVRPCGCCSFVGKRGNGRQAISIGRNCEKFGIVVHELGHVIGFWHEHTRIDRDKHIAIQRTNIMKGQEYNFNVLTSQEVDSLGLPYDYNSIMHYARNTFSRSIYLDTILPIGIEGAEHIEIGQRIKLSKGDISQANLLYKCIACGKTFQQNSGQIVTPNFYSLLNKNGGSGPERCEWRITATNGERIILRINQLNLLASKDCERDYLEIRDGYWYRSPVIKRICGNVTSETIKTDTSRMLLTYVNRNLVRGFQGFKADFEVVCGGEIYLNEGRRIDSPNYPLEYLPDKECIWKITAPENHQVALRFQSFEIENHDNCIYDYVEIRDGDRSDSELIGVFCGFKLPPNIKTNSNKMFLKFVSDSSVQKVGFSAIFMKEVDECKYENHGCEHECINTLGSYECSCFAGFELQSNGKSCEDACGGVIEATTMNNVTLNSPSYPDVYPILKECVWEIVAPAKHSVFVQFKHFDIEGTKFQFTECNYDYLTIYSKLNDNRLKKIGVYCGHEIPSIISSEQNILRIEFHSDKSVQHTGFSAQFIIDVNECETNNGGCQHHCQNTFDSYICSCRNGYTLHDNKHNCTETKCKFEIINSYGIISSPNYPQQYPRNTYCFWHFTTVPGHRVQLTFHEFEMENHQECIYDYLSIHDGKSENSSTLGVYCGGREPYTVVASTNQLFMVLKTDAGLQRKGFMATHSTECGGYLRATNQTKYFYSHPRFGNRPYKRNMFCNWRIQSDPESSVKLLFTYFEIEYSDKCNYDSVEISEELSYIRNSQHGKYCGNQKPPQIISYTDTLLINFQSDESTSLRGFSISYVAVVPPDDDVDQQEREKLNVTPFPGYMKSIFNTYDDYDETNRRNL